LKMQNKELRKGKRRSAFLNTQFSI
jgi:hypothetical protein